MWYYLNLGGGGKANGSEQEELIAKLLDDPIENSYTHALVAVNSSIYQTYYSHAFTSEVQVSDIESREGLPTWKEFTPSLNARGMPSVVSMGRKIYVINIKKKEGSGFDPCGSCELSSIRVLNTVSKSRKWETLPVVGSSEIKHGWFALAYEDRNKLVVGNCMGDCLYLYDVCTFHLERLDLCDGMRNLPWAANRPPVIVRNRLFFFYYDSIIAYDLVERSYWEATIDGLGYSFLRLNCNKHEHPRLVYLGDGKLCLICLRSRIENIKASTVHCCVFGVPEIIEQNGQRSLICDLKLRLRCEKAIGCVDHLSYV